jgi:hypothetical protein
VQSRGTDVVETMRTLATCGAMSQYYQAVAGGSPQIDRSRTELAQKGLGEAVRSLLTSDAR